MYGSLPDPRVCKGQGAEMEYPGFPDFVTGNLFFPQHHIRSRAAVKGKVPVPVRIGVHKRQCGMHLLI